MGNGEMLTVVLILLLGLSYLATEAFNRKKRKKDIGKRIQQFEKNKEFVAKQKEHNLKLFELQKKSSTSDIGLFKVATISSNKRYPKLNESKVVVDKKSNVYQISWKQWIENNKALDNTRLKLVSGQ